MKNIYLWLFLTPFFMAITCDDDDYCGLDEFEGFDVTISNTADTYQVNDLISLSATASSGLFDPCETEDFVTVTDPEMFREGVFLLKIETVSDEINAVIAQDDFVFELVEGDSFNPNGCLESENFTPTLSNDESEYDFQLNFIPQETGLYCIAFAWISRFDESIDVHEGLMNTEDLIDNQIRFRNCNRRYGRLLDRNELYFFRVE